MKMVSGAMSARPLFVYPSYAFKKHYSIAGMMVAINDGTGLQYLLTDHLGSTVAVTNSSGTLTSQQRYLPFGAPRTIPNSPILGTDFTYTGQRKLDDGMGGIMDYKARFYSPALGRFLQPDTIIPTLANPQSLNRFGYVGNNPIVFNDPTGHIKCEFDAQGNDFCYENDRKTKIIKEPSGDSPPSPPKHDCPPRGYCPSVVTIGPSETSEPETSNDPFFGFEIYSEGYDWLELLSEGLTWAINHTRPVYKHIKGVVPGGFWIEAGLGFLSTAVTDLNNPNLTLAQKFLRATIIGLEDGVTDLASTATAAFMAPFGAEFGALVGGVIATPGTSGVGTVPGAGAGGIVGGTLTFVATSYVTTRLVDELWWAPFNEHYFPELFP